MNCTSLSRLWRILAFAGVACVVASRASASPLTLEDAIRLGLEHNRQLKVSAFSRDIARANVLASYGAFDPAITFRRSYRQENTPVSINPFARQFVQTDNYELSLGGLMPWGLTYSIGGTAENERGTFNQFSDQYAAFGGLSMTQPLLRGAGFGATLAPLRVAKANRNISDWEHRQTIIDTVTNVVFAYNALQQAQEELRIARASRTLAAALLDGNIKRNRIGALSDADVIQARARVANREEAILFAQRSVHKLENELRALLGESQFKPEADNLEIVLLPPAASLTVDPAGALNEALKLRPDYQSAKLGITIRRTLTTAAQNQLLPQVDFVGSYGYSGLDRSFAASRAQVRSNDNRAYSAGVVVTVPLTFAEGRGRARASKLALRQAETNLERLEQDIALEVAAAIDQLGITHQRVEATSRARELASQALQAEQKRFEAGASSTFLVLQLQEQLAGVERNQAAALTEERRAVASYERTTGVTLERRHIVAN